MPGQNVEVEKYLSKALIVAERPETLELLKRNSDDLLSSFRRETTLS